MQLISESSQESKTADNLESAEAENEYSNNEEAAEEEANIQKNTENGGNNK